jgi:hypothetical protein
MSKSLIRSNRKTEELQKNMKKKKINSCPKLTISKNSSSPHLQKFPNLTLKKGKRESKNLLSWNRITKILRKKSSK